MKGQRKVVWSQLLLSMSSIALGAALHGGGIVGFWGMITIMMIPNIAFAIMRTCTERRSKQAL